MWLIIHLQSSGSPPGDPRRVMSHNTPSSDHSSAQVAAIARNKERAQAESEAVLEPRVSIRRTASWSLRRLLVSDPGVTETSGQAAGWQKF